MATFALARADHPAWWSNPDRMDAFARDPAWGRMAANKLGQPATRVKHQKRIAGRIYLGASRRARDIAISEKDGLCWVLDNLSGVINVVDIERRRLASSITGLEMPLAIHYLPQTKRLLVLDHERESRKNKIVLIDPHDQTDKTVIAVDALSAHRLCSTVVSHDESTLWVSVPSGLSSYYGQTPSYLYEIDIESGTWSERAASVPPRNNGYRLDFSPNIHCLMDRDGRLIVSGLKPRTISRYNKKTATFDTLVTLKSKVNQIFSDGSTDRVYAVLRTGEVVYFDPYKQKEPVYMGLSGSISSIQHLGKSETVVLADRQTHTLKTYALPASKQSITIDLPGDKFGFPVGVERLALHEESQTLVAIVREGGALALYDLHKRVGTFLDVKGGWCVRIPPGSELAIVCNRNSDNLSVVDLSTDRFLGTIPVQGQPADIRFRPDGQLGVVFDIDGNAIGVLDVTAREMQPKKEHEIPDDLLPAEPRTLAIGDRSGNWVKVPGWIGVEWPIIINNEKGRSYWRLFARNLTSVVLSPDENWAYVLCEKNNGPMLLKVPVRNTDIEAQSINSR